MAAVIAYYTLFSLFPLLLGLIAILGLFLEGPEVQRRLLEMASQVFPASRDLVAENIEAVVASRGVIGLFSIGGLLWSATSVFAAIRKSLNRAWNTEGKRPLVQQKLLELAMVASVGLLFLVSVMATAFFSFVRQFMPTDLSAMERNLAWGAVTGLLPGLVSFVTYSLLYRFVPDTEVSWADVWPGALLAAALFEAAKDLFAWYLADFANYPLVYGSLGAVIAFLFWAYLSALILLLGAELSAEYAKARRQRRKPRP